jgi:hypothetical protein
MSPVDAKWSDRGFKDFYFQAWRLSGFRSILGQGRQGQINPETRGTSINLQLLFRHFRNFKTMETPFAIATNVEKEPGNNYRIDIEIIVPVTLEKFRLDLNDLGDQPHQIGGFPASGEWGNVVVTTRGLPRLKPGDKVPVILQESQTG